VTEVYCLQDEADSAKRSNKGTLPAAIAGSDQKCLLYQNNDKAHSLQLKNVSN
jgi:hypothetical protein